MKSNPCRYCKTRYLGCHDRCEPRKEWLSELHRVKQIMKKEKELQAPVKHVRRKRTKPD